jgi:SAM-dependent methyltransferase
VRLDDPELVAREYAAPARLAGRVAGHRFGEGPDARELLFTAVAEARPERLIEAGCGDGWLSQRAQAELGCKVVAFDQSEQMVDLARARGVDARVGRVEELPLADGEWDCAVAAWMLFHVRNVDRALGELARVLRPGGRLVAVTNGRDHLRELADLLGVERPDYTFSAENGEAQLRRHFARVERRDASASIVFPGRAEAQEFVDNTIVWRGRRLPDVEGPIRVRRTPAIFVAET